MLCIGSGGGRPSRRKLHALRGRHGFHLLVPLVELEYRFTPHIGLFGEAGYDFPNGASNKFVAINGHVNERNWIQTISGRAFLVAIRLTARSACIGSRAAKTSGACRM